MGTRILIAISLLILTTSCVSVAPVPTHLPTTTVLSATVVVTPIPTGWPTPPKTVSPDYAHWPTSTPHGTPVTRPPYTPATRPPDTPVSTCPPIERGEVDPRTFVPVGPLKEEQSFQEYTVRIYKDRTCFREAFEILQNGQRVYARLDSREFTIGDKYDANAVPMGQDITGDGIPDLLLHQWTWGAHCCFYLYIFQIGEEFQPLGSIYTEETSPRLIDLDNDGNLEFIILDWAYIRYGNPWHQHYSPRPEVILHYDQTGYHLAPNLMRKPAPTNDSLAAWAGTLQGRDKGPLMFDVDLWGYILELIYSGNADSAETLLTMIWPDDLAQRDEFTDHLLAMLSESQYWPEIKELSVNWPWPEK